MNEMPLVIPCTFGHTNLSVGSGQTGSYVSLRNPALTEGCALRTYPTQPGTDVPVDLPNASISSPRARIDSAGHLLLER